MRRSKGVLPPDWPNICQHALREINRQEQSVATRKASQIALQALAPALPELIGGSADLTPSNNTFWSGCKDVSGEDAAGNYIRYGVREFGMSAIMNGMALYGGFIPYSGTFLTFSDYARNAVRMAALMNTHSLFVYTHDSIGLGEDGPTHQAVEHLASLRSIPDLKVWRPCDSVESLVAWQNSIEAKSPAALVFSRQSVAFIRRTQAQLELISKGAYVLFESRHPARIIIIATGSEVALCLAAARQLAAQGIGVRLISMPCAEVFERQPESYKESILPAALRLRLAVEAGVSDYWRKYVGLDGDIIGVDQFGASAPGEVLMQHFGFTVDNIIQRAQALLRPALNQEEKIV